MSRIPKTQTKQAGKKHRPLAWLILLLLAALILLLLVSVSLGPSSLSIGDSFKILIERLPLLGRLLPQAEYADKYYTIIFDLRLPRVLLSSLVGASLALVGAVFQSVFRNPLADPHILGISSGAALGATLAVVSGLNVAGILGLGSMGLFAFIGALLTVAIVFVAAGTRGNDRAMTTMLLIGVALGTLFASIISLLMLFNHDKITRVYLWTMGSFSAASWPKVYFVTAIFIPCAVYLLTQGRNLNLLLAGEEEALGMGLDTARQRKTLILVCSLLVATTVSVSGIIGFVGLIIPQLLRVLGQNDLRRQLPLALLVGGIFVLFCDTVARTLLAPVEVPVGIITSLFGVPYFISAIIRQRKKEQY